MSLYILRDWEVPRRHLLQPRLEFDFTPDFILPLTLDAFQNQMQCKQKIGTPVEKTEDGSFIMSVDVQQFKPEEISLKIVDRSIVLEAKHEEKQDEHGFVSREFVRRYVLPEDYDIAEVSSKLSSDGVLSIIAPPVKKEQGERIIPVIRSGPAMKLASADTSEEKKET